MRDTMHLCSRLCAWHSCISILPPIMTYATLLKKSLGCYPCEAQFNWLLCMRLASVAVHVKCVGLWLCTRCYAELNLTLQRLWRRLTYICPKPSFPRRWPLCYIARISYLCAYLFRLPPALALSSSLTTSAVLNTMIQRGRLTIYLPACMTLRRIHAIFDGIL